FAASPSEKQRKGRRKPGGLCCCARHIYNADMRTSGRVVVAMSGGVDSSVAAYLLRKQGYEIIGLFMRTGTHSAADDHRAEHKKGCCSAIDAGDARRVADQLDIPFYA